MVVVAVVDLAVEEDSAVAMVDSVVTLVDSAVMVVAVEDSAAMVVADFTFVNFEIG